MRKITKLRLHEGSREVPASKADIMGNVHSWKIVPHWHLFVGFDDGHSIEAEWLGEVTMDEFAKTVERLREPEAR